MFSSRQSIIALAMCLFTVFIGTAGYIYIEGYSLVDSLYMTIITVTTVGFGEVKPLSTAGRGFTSLLIVFGFISLAFTGRAVAESFYETIWSGKAEIKKMKKKISQLKSHYIICGYGRVGASAVNYFTSVGAEFVIIESNSDSCNELKEKGLLYVEGDATRETILLETGIKSASGLIALLDTDPENLFIVLSARDLNPVLHIIARAGNVSSEKKILRAGADSVISPFKAAGRQIAVDILAATGKSSPHLDKPKRPFFIPHWVNVGDRSDLIGGTIAAISEKTGLNVVGLRRDENDFILPEPETKVEGTDLLLVLAEETTEDTESCKEPHKYKKIVIVDDNPVILRVFSRLFQKAGFNPITAEDGSKGLKKIIHERPVAAVIDYVLPGISGIDVCRKVRSNDDCKQIKLILFTSDRNPETKQRAIEAGADAVVIKSPESSEIIKKVIEILEEDSHLDKSVENVIIPEIEKNNDFSSPTKKEVHAKSIDIIEALDTMEGDKELLKECFDDFMDNHVNMLQDIGDAIAADDPPSVDKSSHRFKGSLIYLAAKPAADLAFQLESMGKNSNLSQAENALSALKKECENIRTFIAGFE